MRNNEVVSYTFSDLMIQHSATDIKEIVAEAIHDKKGSGIRVIDLSGIETAPAHTFIICQARNPIQVAAVADSVVDSVLENAGRKPVSTSGYRNREWVIVDYGDIIVHVFMPETRERYALEELYGDAPFTDIPDEE